MATISVFALFLILHFTSLPVSEATNRRTRRERCNSPFTCQSLHDMKFPFYSTQMPPDCGLFMVNCSKEEPQIQLKEGGKWYKVVDISQGNNIIVTDLELERALSSSNCSDLSSFSLPDTPWLRLKTVYRCNQKADISSSKRFSYHNCEAGGFFYALPEDSMDKFPPECSAFKIPEIWEPSESNRNIYLNATFSVNITPLGRCYGCHYRGGTCSINHEKNITCVGGEKGGSSQRRMELGLGIGGSLALIIILAALLIIPRFFRRRNGSDFISGNDSSDRYSKSDVESSHVFFKIPVFSYKELEEATNNFSGDRLLGDGGFGTVYYGKLQDGREVAVKRLYEHNFRRVQQFINEIEILTRLQHQNLVSLYGCTSRKSRELLLVYEFVRNGTVADHLHGDLSKPGSLPWPMRMNIAIQTASALAYLHASDIIHRDVKTTNILLDTNFSVKVADFGLSRLFPNDVTHVSTAPQGTPGYVDPEYHQCYQLTDKSDVYSFGVVLVELISSKPAVDINRSKTEINLSNLAVNRIQKQAYDELIDPGLGYKTDEKVRKMTTMVAELAFQCLQQDKAMRPTMDEVLQELQRIQNEEQTNHDHDQEQKHDEDDEEIKQSFPPASPLDWTKASLLKNIRYPRSPISVTEQWVSKSTTPNTSL